MTKRPIVLSSTGSLGDIYPILSLALALQDRGRPTRLALAPEHADLARHWGLDAQAIGPSEAEMLERAGLDHEALAQIIFQDPTPFIIQHGLPLLKQLVEDLTPLIDRAAGTAGTVLSMALPLSAERGGLPHVPILLQPAVMMSALDPPRMGWFRLQVGQPAGPVARGWNRVFAWIVDQELRRRFRRPLTDIRSNLGLPPQRSTPLFDTDARVPLRLGMWDPRFAPVPGDRPDLRLSGFPVPPHQAPLDPNLASFLSHGPVPVVVTLGSHAHQMGGDGFWFQAAEALKTAGLRGVLLAGDGRAPGSDETLFVTRQAPHDPLFQQAHGIIHHGGIGTTAATLRAGKPQIILPIGGDQTDNAARARRLGLAETLPIGKFRGGRAIKALHRMADRAQIADNFARQMIPDGAARAAEILDQAIPA